MTVATKAMSSLTLDDVAFGVLTCHKYLGTRLLAQRRTWLRGMRHVAAFSDAAPSADLGRHLNVQVIVDGRHPGPKELMAADGAPRALMMVEALRTSFPHAKWYFFADDDTFVYVPTLLQEVFSKRNYTDGHYIGWAYQPGSFQGFQHGEWIPRVAIGGAGFAISHGLMEKLAPEVPRCSNAYTWDWPGDLRIAQCIADVGCEVEDDPHFHPENPHLELQFGRNWQATRPVSFHHLSPDDMYQLSAGQHVLSKTHMLEANFADLALAGISFRDVAANLTVSLLFGLEVNISASHSTAPLNAGKLLSFVSAVPGSGHDFEQEYQGRRISVHLDLVCGNCPAGASSVQTMAASTQLVACSLHSAGTRTFRILLAARQCPQFLPGPLHSFPRSSWDTAYPRIGSLR